MELNEKILIFRTCGMVLWVLKNLVRHSNISDRDSEKIIEKIDGLIKPVTAQINDLQTKWLNQNIKSAVAKICLETMKKII